jgi:hypothetical protein
MSGCRDFGGVAEWKERRGHSEEREIMNPTEIEWTIPPEIRAEMELAIDNAMKGIRDPELMRKAGERMDRMSEELRQRVGELNVAVDLIREGRDEE